MIQKILPKTKILTKDKFFSDSERGVVRLTKKMVSKDNPSATSTICSGGARPFGQSLVTFQRAEKTKFRISQCGTVDVVINCRDCTQTFKKEGLKCMNNYHNDEDCFKARHVGALDRLGVYSYSFKSLVLSKGSTISLKGKGRSIFQVVDRNVKLKSVVSSLKGLKGIILLNLDDGVKRLRVDGHSIKEYINYRMFYTDKCKHLTIGHNKKVYLHELKEQRALFLSKLRRFIFYLRHPGKMSKKRRHILNNVLGHSFKKGYNFYTVGNVDYSFVDKHTGRIKVDDGGLYTNLHGHFAVSDYYFMPRDLLIDLWYVLFGEKVHNLFIKSQSTDAVFSYIARRCAGQFGHASHGNLHYFSDVMTVEQYAEIFYGSRSFKAYGISKKMVCSSCGERHTIKQFDSNHGLCSLCASLLRPMLLTWNNSRSALFITTANNRYNVCPYCLSRNTVMLDIRIGGHSIFDRSELWEL